MREGSSVSSRSVQRSTTAPVAHEVAFSGDVVLPVSDLHVEAAVDLEHCPAAVGEWPFGVGVAHPTRGIEALGLTRGKREAVIDAHRLDLGLGE